MLNPRLGTGQQTEDGHHWPTTIGSLASRGHGLLRSLVMVTPLLAGLLHRHDRCRALALDCCPALGAWLRSSAPLRMGLRTDGTRNPRTYGSAEEARCRGLLSLRAESDVPWFHCGMDRPLDRLRISNTARHRDRLRTCARRRFVRRVLRGAHAASEVRHRLRRILPECPALDASSAPMELMMLARCHCRSENPAVPTPISATTSLF